MVRVMILINFYNNADDFINQHRESIMPHNNNPMNGSSHAAFRRASQAWNFDFHKIEKQVQNEADEQAKFNKFLAQGN